MRDFDGYYERISHADEKRLMKLLEDFYKKSDFHSFFESHPVDLKSITLEDWILMDEIDKKFVMIRDIIDVLEEREADYGKYPTMSDFMPRYVETINGMHGGHSKHRLASGGHREELCATQ